MKTPREILLQHHQEVTPKLDAIRQSALASLASERSADGLVRANGSYVGSPTLYEFFLSLRWHLAGMSAVWLLVALLNINLSPTPPTAIARKHSPSPQQLLMAMRENRRLLLELMEPPVGESISAPRPLAPPRRSELHSASAMA